MTKQRIQSICFEPLKEFKWFRKMENGETKLIGVYQPGLEYTCTPQPKHDVLFAQMQIWLEEKKIRVYPKSASPRQVRVVAKGVVSDKKGE